MTRLLDRDVRVREGSSAHVRGRQRSRRLVLLLGLVLAALLVPVVPAAAGPLDGLCKEAPAPVRPDSNAVGLVMDKPDPADIPAQAPDPFADPSVPISSVYGWSWRYTNYDLGCGSDYIRDPSAVATTNLANVAMIGVATMGASVESVENMSRSASFDLFKPVVASVAGTLSERVLTVWLPLALLVVSIVLAFSAVRASYSETFRRLMIVIVCVGLAVVALVFPVRATDVMDEGAKAVASAAQAGFNPRASDVITRESVYKTWLVGNFGSADSPTAKEYGPRLMGALTYSWSEAKAIDANPGLQEGIDKAKADEFTKIAGEIEKKDTAAYAALTGKADTRTATTILGVVWVAIMGFFVALAALITILARLIMIALVVAAMVGTVVGVVHFPALQRMWDLFTAAIVNTVKFVIAAGVMTLVLGAIQTAPVGMGWRLLFAIVATVIAVMITKPIASFKSMSGLDPNQRYLSGVLSRISGAASGVAGAAAGTAGSGLGSYLGHRAAHRTGVADGDGWDRDTHYTVQQMPVEPSMPSLPAAGAAARPLAGAPRYSALGWSGSTPTGPRPALETGTGPVPPSPNALPPEIEVLVPTEDPRRIRPVTVVPLAPGVDVRRPVVAEQTTSAPAQELPPADPTVRVGGPGDVGPAERPLRVTLTAVPPVTADPTGPRTGPPAGPSTSSGPRVDAPPPIRPEPAVYPTGIVVQNEPGMYRSGSQLKVEEYLRFPEPQVDANGEETWTPLYHARAKAR